jgi:hypothetical protein
MVSIINNSWAQTSAELLNGILNTIKDIKVEVIKEVPVEVIKEVPVEVIKEVPVEVIKEVEVEVIKEVPVVVTKEVIVYRGCNEWLPINSFWLYKQTKFATYYKLRSQDGKRYSKIYTEAEYDSINNSRNLRKR